MTGRLVDSEGYINRDAFYNYLTAWTTNDALVYSASMALIHPLPKEWYHDATDKDVTSKFYHDYYSQDLLCLNALSLVPLLSWITKIKPHLFHSIN